MDTLDRRIDRATVCFGCGQVVDGAALEVWAATGGPVLAVLCEDCRADPAVREALVAHLLAHGDPGRACIVWADGDHPTRVVSAPITKAAILARLVAGESFSFGA